MTVTIDQGKHGLYYLTDSDNPAIFIAGGDPETVQAYADMARLAIPEKRNFTNHVMHETEGGRPVTIPHPDNMTPEQRSETIDRLKIHLQTYFRQ